MNNFKENVEQYIEFSQKNGASQTQLSLLYSDDFSVSIRNGEIEELDKSISNVLNLKINVNDKIATASTSDLRPSTINKLILNTIQRAKYSEPDPFARLADFITNDFDVNKLQIFDPNIESIPIDEKIHKARQLERICLADKRISLSDGAFFSSSMSKVFLGNSNGFLSGFNSTSFATGIHLHTHDDNNSFEDGWYDNSVFYSDLLDIEQIANIAVSRATRLIGARKISSQNLDVIFEPLVASSLFGLLSACISGNLIYMNRSCLANLLHNKIAPDILTINDIPNIPRSLGSIPFDSDGLPVLPLNIIKNGILNNYLLDSYYARKLNMSSNARASGITNLIISPGNISQDDLIRSTKKGLLITSTIGQGTNTTTGDISKGAFGLMIEDGEITFPVHEITFSANLLSILNNIEAIANNPIKNRTIQSPSIKVNNISISGL